MPVTAAANPRRTPVCPNAPFTAGRERPTGDRSGAHRLVPFGAVTRPGWAAM